MKSRILVLNRRSLVVVALLLFCIGSGSTAVREWTVTPLGVGPVRIGLNLSQLGKVLNERFSMPADKEEQGCFYVDSAKHKNMNFMIEDRRFARVDISEPGIFTDKGVQVGDSEAQVLKAYGSRMKVEPHAYTGPEGHYLTFREGKYGVRFETDEGKVTSFYAGLFSAIQYIEGCE